MRFADNTDRDYNNVSGLISPSQKYERNPYIAVYAYTDIWEQRQYP